MHQGALDADIKSAENVTHTLVKCLDQPWDNFL